MMLDVYRQTGAVVTAVVVWFTVKLLVCLLACMIIIIITIDRESVCSAQLV